MGEYKFDENDERSLNKMHLDTFVYNLNNSFEAIADKEIERLILEIKESIEKYKALNKEITSNLDEKKWMELESEKHYCLEDNEYREEEIWSIIEMKIIYAFKFLEVNIKRLIKISFSQISIKRLYKWELIIEFFKNKNIEICKFKCYSDILQLKKVNNAIKHSSQFSEELKKNIPEFRNRNEIKYSELNDFYNRIKLSPTTFIHDLTYAVYDELYEFDENKIENIASKFVSRMEKEDAKKLMDLIIIKYK